MGIQNLPLDLGTKPNQLSNSPQRSALAVALKHDATLRDKVDAVYATLPAIFPGHWEKWHGETDSTGVWAQSLLSLNGDQVMAGLKELCRMPGDFAPTPGGFHAVCLTAYTSERRAEARAAEEAAAAQARLPRPDATQQEAWMKWAHLRFAARCTDSQLQWTVTPCPDESGDLARVVNHCAVPGAEETGVGAHKPYWEHMRAEVKRIFF